MRKTRLKEVLHDSCDMACTAYYVSHITRMLLFVTFYTMMDIVEIYSYVLFLMNNVGDEPIRKITFLSTL